MREIECKHCGNIIKAEDTSCPACGMPLAPEHAKASQKRFLIFFVVIVIFSISMMLLLPLWD